MRYLLFICTDPEAEPYRADLDTIQTWVAENDAQGIRLAGERLRPPEDAKTVRVRRGQTLVTDGPFAESKEWMAGFDILECPDLDAAIGVASRHPMARFGRIEVRPFLPGATHPSLARPLPADHGSLIMQLMCTDPEAEPYRADQDDTSRWVDEMVGRGLLLMGQVLRPVTDATLVRVRHDQVLVTDGPFAETKEWINGFGILRCSTMDEAVAVTASHPAARFGRIELRALWPFG
jgi:hypothetical protein